MNTESKLMVVIVVIIIYFSSLLVYNSPEERTQTIYLVNNGSKVEPLNSTDYLLRSQVSCDSQSMGLLISCKDTLLSRILEEDEKLIEGRIYKYRSPSGYYKVHRLVKCLDENCSTLVFKGDNNFRADPIVSRHKVEQEVVQIRYG